MRFTTFNRMLRGGARVKHTVAHLDCAHQIEYDGFPDEAEHRVRQDGGTVSKQGGFTRCAACSKEYAQTLYNVIKELKHA